MLDGGTCRQQYNRDMARLKIRFYLLAEFYTRHLGHHNITYNDVRHYFLRLLQPLFPIGSGHHFIVRFKQSRQHLPQRSIVFHNQHFSPFDSVLHIFIHHLLFQLQLRFGRHTQRFFFHRFGVNLFFQEMLFAQFQINGKGGALIQMAADLNASFMQFDKTLAQSQTDAGSLNIARVP